MNEKKFFNLCRREFNCLMKDFDFRISTEKKHKWGYQVFMKNTTTGIIITFEFRDFYVFLKICKLENGDFVEDNTEILPTTKINNFDYENLLLIRSPDSIYPVYKDDTVFNDDLIEKIIRTHAKNLSENAKDILNGDFSVFTELEKMVKQRMQMTT